MFNSQNFAIKGNILYSKNTDQISCIPDGYIVCDSGKVKGVFETLPQLYSDITIIDYGDKLIIPGLIDLHTHAPQYSFRGLGMDLELIDWLNQNTFLEEAKYSDLEYAKKAYSIFADDLKNSATTRVCIFGTIHVESTNLLMDLLEASGLKCMVGKVNMDRNSPEYLCESSVKSIEDTKKWLRDSTNKYKNVTPIITPRFLPTCTGSLLTELSKLQKVYNCPIQSHLSENIAEVEWVKELFPESKNYGHAYETYGMFGKEVPTIMAHCVYSTKEEIELMKQNQVYVAHCPESNTNLSSGIAPVRTFIEEKIPVGLGTDLAAGSSNSIFRAMAGAIQVSKLRWRLVDQKIKPLTPEEAFYLGTKGGGAFFGKTGSFEEGYEFDAVILDDSNLLHPQPLTLKQRLERIIYLSDDRNVYDKYVAGKCIGKGIGI
ncbi:MAG: amidohydrolase family protein [Anaerocolumna sp.]